MLRQSLNANAARRTSEEHPESPARQRPRCQTFPFPTPQDWHQTSAGQYMQHVYNVMAPNEQMLSVERQGRNCKKGVVSDPLLPPQPSAGGFELTTTKLQLSRATAQRRWPAHVSHTETFFVYPRELNKPAFIGAQVTIKDTLIKEINIWKLPEEQQEGHIEGVACSQGEWSHCSALWANSTKDSKRTQGQMCTFKMQTGSTRESKPRVDGLSKVNFHDPDIDLVSRSVPTPATGDVPMALQLMASFGIRAWTADCKSAFMQSDQGQRPQPLFALPPNDGLPGETEDIIIELKTEVYGLVSGPGGWRCTLLRHLQSNNWRRHPLAPCVFLFFEEVQQSNKLTGVLVVETDDLLAGSNGPMATENQSRCLRRETSSTGFRYVLYDLNGRLRQGESYTAVQLDRGRQDDDQATEKEITCLRGLLGSLMWAGREGVPHRLGEVSLLSSTLPTPKVKHIKAANACCLKRHLQAPVSIRILPLKPEELHFVVLTDASFDNLGNGRTQVGWMVLTCEALLVTQAEGKVSPLTFGSSALHRAASSTLCCEAFAMSMGLSHAEWAMELWKLATDCNYDLRQRTQNPHDIEIKALIHDPSAEPPKLLAVTDAKSLYDTVNKESYSHTERRAALEVSVIRDSLKLLEGQIRWVPHALNAADSMTKLGANAQSMVRLLAEGQLCLRAEESILAERKQFRAETGRQCPRPHRKS
eukprot:6478282-Amphidinium_carterae.4